MCFLYFKTLEEWSLGSWREFGCRDDANAWRKSTKEADKHKNFLLQFRKSKNLSMHWRHHHTNSHQSSSVVWAWKKKIGPLAEIIIGRQSVPIKK